MKSYLQSLKRNELVKLYANFGANQSIRSNIIKHKNNQLIEALVEEQVLTIDTAQACLNKETTNEVVQAKKTAEVIANPSEEIESIETFKQDKIESTDDMIISKKIANQNQNLRELAAKMKEEALETIVVKISPINDTDIRAKGKNSEVIMVANQFFSVAKAVPFNVKCELPKCIVKVAQEAVAPVYTPFDDMDVRKKTGRLGIYSLAPKYNVIVYGKTDEVIESETNKKRLGL